MQALRIVLKQRIAHYRKEETNINKMTYPLPPFSTVIGAMHYVCGYKEYHPMDISIQGDYDTLNKEAYTDYCFLNSVQDDRGILVKMKNDKLLSTAFERVGKAKKSQGNSFRNGVTIEILDEQLLEEYRNLKDMKDQMDEFKKTRLNAILKLIKDRKKSLKEKLKKVKGNLGEEDKVKSRLQEVTYLEKSIKEKWEESLEKEYNEPYSKFATLTTSIKYYEVLNNVELIIHIRADEEVLSDIENNIFNLTSLGRSEDFVHIDEIKRVELDEEIDDEVYSTNSAYIDYDLFKNGTVFRIGRGGVPAEGTKYYITKNYTIEDKKRVFNKKKVMYVSHYTADKPAPNLYLDREGETTYIVNFN